MREAYFRAERCGFEGGDAVEDWLAAEAQIDRIIQAQAVAGTNCPEQKQAFEERLAIRLKEWDVELDKCGAKVQQLKSKARAEMENSFEVLRAKRAEIERHSQALREREEGASDDL